tara:strand:+ start:633 stop:1964 length:1332 start_codon:yes stop_codon:yes gene_type:complete
MGSIVKGVGSLFGGKARRREQGAANKEFEAAKKGVTEFNFKDPFADLEANKLGTATAYDAISAKAGDPLGAANQAKMGNINDSQGFGAFTDSAVGYTAQNTNVAGLARGADTGLTNTFNQTQVNTAQAAMDAQEADQTLAASQDLIAQTGGGGATALAAAAAKSKAGIAASIGQQESANEIRRASAESTLQQQQLAQGNLGSQFDLGQSQFNATASNDQMKFNAGQTNQMAMANMDAQNRAAEFEASAFNTSNLQQYDSQNKMNQYNVTAQNANAAAQFGADNKFALANQQAGMAAAQFGAEAQNQFAMQNQKQLNAFNIRQADGARDIQESQYAQETDTFGIASGRKMAADNARKQAKSDLMGGITGLLGSDRRLKKNIKLIGLSPSGIKIYRFEYKDNSFGKGIYQGVMSDEITQQAVVTGKDGFDRVDYSLLDVEFKLIK